MKRVSQAERLKQAESFQAYLAQANIASPQDIEKLFRDNPMIEPDKELAPQLRQALDATLNNAPYVEPYQPKNE
jgi:hypothetical protein